MLYRLSFEIPGLPRMTNNSGRTNTHWRDKMRERDQWQEQVGWIVRASKGPPAPIKKAHLTLTRYSSVAPDPDGLVAGFKYIIDALVKFGVLENDRYTNIGMPHYLWVKAPPKAGKVSVVIEEIPCENVMGADQG